MKQLLVISDSHGDKSAVLRCIQAEPQASALIFLGDGIGDLNAAKAELNRKLPCYVVRGNCDFGFEEPGEGLAAFEGTLIFYTHGHNYNVRFSAATLSRTAEARGADLALYGHTHEASNFGGKGITPCFNPGSCSRPRGMRGPTYGLLTLERGKDPVFQVKPVPKQI